MFQSLIWIKWWSSAPNPSLHLQCRIQLFFSKNLPKSFSIINYVCLGYHHIHSAKQMLQIKTLPGIEFYHVYFPPDLDFSDGANDTRASIIMSTWDNCLILGVFAWYRGFGNLNFVCYKKWQNCVILPSFKGWPLHSCISINHWTF